MKNRQSPDFNPELGGQFSLRWSSNDLNSSLYKYWTRGNGSRINLPDNDLTDEDILKILDAFEKFTDLRILASPLIRVDDAGQMSLIVLHEPKSQAIKDAEKEWREVHTVKLR